MVRIDEIVRRSMIVHVIRSMGATEPSAPDVKSTIVADFQASMGELKCVGSERLVRLGISMAQLHVMHMLEGHGELPMSRLAEMLDVSLSAATVLYKPKIPPPPYVRELVMISMNS